MKVYLAGSSKEISRCKIIGMDLAADVQVETLHAWTNLAQDGSVDERLAWRTCLRQVREADCVVIVSPITSNIQLNGAILEVGYALALAKPVILYDLHATHRGTWLHIEAIRLVTSWPELIRELQF